MAHNPWLITTLLQSSKDCNVFEIATGSSSTKVSFDSDIDLLECFDHSFDVWCCQQVGFVYEFVCHGGA